MGLLDHDDLLAPNALYEIVNALQDHPQADALYTDEDKVTTDLDEHFQPHLKPDFNLDLLRSNNYICHFFVVRRSIVERQEVSEKSLTGHRIMILFSAAQRMPEKCCMFRRFCITGEHIKRPQQIIRPARCTLLKRERGQ